jgi:transcriptional repressor NrdR
MVCIYCQSPTDVVNSRPQKRQNRVWRRRHCNSCDATFSTIEDAERTTSYMVRSQGRLQPFLRDKLLVSVYNSCKHRARAIYDAGALTDTILGRVPEVLSDGAVIESVHLRALVLDVLEKFDKVASTHYQAFHPH